MPTALPGARGRIALIGAGVEVGASCLGAGMGPAALRVAGLPAALAELGYTVEDRGDLRPSASDGLPPPITGLAKYPAEIVAWARAIDAAVSGAFSNGALPLVMGGDHSLAMGSVRAAARHAAAATRPLFLLWLDAHPDFNTPATSLSGNMHGMSVAAFHARFKSVTSSSPLRYLKNIRLHKARMLMINDGINASVAAVKVGYESASQFSREFKRLFGNSPVVETAQMRRYLLKVP